MVDNFIRLMQTLLCIYVCMVITYSKGKDQPCRLPILLVVSYHFLCPRSRLRIWYRETGSAVRPRVSLLISILRLNLVLTVFLPSSVAASIRHWVCPEFLGSRKCVPMAINAESPPEQGQ